MKIARHILLLLLSALPLDVAHGARLLVEAETFAKHGGWVVDQQFMDIMGSPYLLAHGMGRPVADAETDVVFPHKGDYYAYVRTYNWTAPWHDGAGPGRFALVVDGCELERELGTEGSDWMWQLVGLVHVDSKRATIALRDKSGFDGRCDAIYFTDSKDDVPPADLSALAAFRRRMIAPKAVNARRKSYDLVVVGGGVAGISAAVSACRLGLKVALVHDRKVAGGNNSSEVRVHLGGRINQQPFPRLGDLQKEFGPLHGGNAKPADNYEDDKKMQFLRNEPNLDLYFNYHANGVEMAGNHIAAVKAVEVEQGCRLTLRAPLFCDCTGDGVLGVLAGADWTMGREARSQFGEAIAPEQADSLVMGSSVQWYSVEDSGPTGFPDFDYGLDLDTANCQRVLFGEWTWETGMERDQITEFERVRDYGLLVVYSNWSCLKNRIAQPDRYANRRLGWVAYVAGKRESRRLLGDHILTEGDIVNRRDYPDASFITTWTIDLHFPDSVNKAQFPTGAWKSATNHIPIHPYAAPYRCLYSRNVDNLFMAGRCISQTHVALGTTRVMRTCGMMGEVAGMAASLCRKHKASPRDIYNSHLSELKALMKAGVGRTDLPNNQKYNQGRTLGAKAKTIKTE